MKFPVVDLPPELVRRFLDNLVIEEDHFMWDGWTTDKGYGRLSYKGKYYHAHRLAWEIFKGPIPDGLVMDHLCRITGCENVDHLEPVTHAVNMQRGRSANAEKTTCPRGHPYVIRWGTRRCKICDLEGRRKRDIENRDAINARARERNSKIPREESYQVRNKEKINAHARARYAAQPKEERYYVRTADEIKAKKRENYLIENPTARPRGPYAPKRTTPAE